MADEPLDELEGMTPLEYADTKAMDELAKKSEIGMSYTIPKGMSPGSDTANLAVLGYNPKEYYTGRSPLEALSIGVDMKDTDIAIRCNIVTLSEEDMPQKSILYDIMPQESISHDIIPQESISHDVIQQDIISHDVMPQNDKPQEHIPYEQRTVIDHSSGEITTDEAKELIKTIKDELENEEFKFYVGTSYRHLLIWDKGKIHDLIPPHDILGKKAGEFLPENDLLKNMMIKSYDILKDHQVNIKRAEKGLNKANSIWFWGAGTKPMLDSFEEKTGKKGAMISAVDLLKGIAAGTGMTNIHVKGADGTLHTNYEGKAMAAVDAVLNKDFDFVYVHVEAPDEMGHQGSVTNKIKAIEALDNRLIRIVKEEMDKSGEDYKLLIMPDHPTPVRLRTHTTDPVPYLLYDSTKKLDETWNYNEKEASESKNIEKEGYKLINKFLS